MAAAAGGSEACLGRNERGWTFDDKRVNVLSKPFLLYSPARAFVCVFWEGGVAYCRGRGSSNNTKC